MLKGKIKVLAPARVTGYAQKKDGTASGGLVCLGNGEDVEASAVVVSTGYTCSWDALMDGKMINSCAIVRG